MARTKKLLHEDFSFPVVREKVIQTNQKDTGYDYLYNGNNGEPISVVSRKYKLVEHDKVNDFALRLFEENKIDYEISKTEVTHEGAKFYREFKLPEFQVDPALLTGVKNTALDGSPETDGYQLRTILQNSYDRSKAFHFTFGAYRLVCSNGMVVGNTIQNFVIRHNQTPNFQRLGENFLELLETSVDWVKTFYVKLNSMEIDNSLLKTLLIETLGKRLQIEAVDLLIKKEIVSAIFNTIEKQYEDIVLNKNVSAYLIYNVITELITQKVYGMHQQNAKFRKLNELLIK